MGFVQDNRDHANFRHLWLNLSTKVSQGDGEIGAGLMGDIAIKQLKMNSRRRIPRRHARRHPTTLP
jgi:hypothetical protein